MSIFKHNKSEKNVAFVAHRVNQPYLYLFNIVMIFWNELQQIINSRCKATEKLALNSPSIPLGLDATQTQNKDIGQIKQYIYNCKVFKDI